MVASAILTGHNEYTDTKPCPCFDVKADQSIQDAMTFGRNNDYSVTFPLQTEMSRAISLAKSQAKAKAPHTAPEGASIDLQSEKKSNVAPSGAEGGARILPINHV